MYEVEAFRDLEDKYLIAGTYANTLQHHRVVLSDLISQGEAIVSTTRTSGLPESFEAFKLEDMEATFESLHTTFRHEHGPKNSEKTNALIARLFDGPKS